MVQAVHTQVHTQDLFQNFSTEKLHCSSDCNLPCRNKKYANPQDSADLCSTEKKYEIRKLVKDKAGEETKTT